MSSEFSSPGKTSSFQLDPSWPTARSRLWVRFIGTKMRADWPSRRGIARTILARRPDPCCAGTSSEKPWLMSWRNPQK